MPRPQRPPPGPQPSRHPRGTAGDRPEPHAPAGPRCTGSPTPRSGCYSIRHR